MINITLRAKSIPNLDAWADAIQLGAEDAAPVIGEVLREAADTCFVEQRDPWGVPWEPLKDATVRERERLGKQGKILIRDSVLRNSIAASPTTRTPGVTSATIFAGGPAEAYASWHQFGPFARAYLPIRPNGDVDLPAEVDAEVAATIKDAIDARMAVAISADLAAEE